MVVDGLVLVITLLISAMNPKNMTHFIARLSTFLTVLLVLLLDRVFCFHLLKLTVDDFLLTRSGHISCLVDLWPREWARPCRSDWIFGASATWSARGDCWRLGPLFTASALTQEASGVRLQPQDRRGSLSPPDEVHMRYPDVIRACLTQTIQLWCVCNRQNNVVFGAVVFH